MNPNDPCLGCVTASGDFVPVGGVIARAPGLIAHGNASKSPIPGWVVITSVQHARGMHDLEDDAVRSLGPLARRVARAQRDVLGAEHSYAIFLGEVLHHFHLHVFPRYGDTPPHLRGRGAFDARPEEILADEVIEAAAARLREALKEG
jgi:diadenosine tetraphosphate (Ap4A) HIT family hydrolase